LEGSVPDLRGQLAGLLSGTVTLVQFQRWIGLNSLGIELHGSAEDVELLNVVDIRLAEYTSNYIGAGVLVQALRDDHHVRAELAIRHATIA
jgi:hypothetical protein